jgi:hypothetical protein
MDYIRQFARDIPNLFLATILIGIVVLVGVLLLVL